MIPLLSAGCKLSLALKLQVIVSLLVALALIGCGASGGQLRWQPALVLTSGTQVVTLPRIPAHPATTAECPEAPAPSRAGSSLDSEGDHQTSSTSSGEEDQGGGSGGVTMSSENAEEDESAGWE